MKTNYAACMLSVLLLTACPSPSFAMLGSESQKAIGISALKGGLAALGTYVGGYWIFNDFKFPDAKNHKLALSISAALGAATMAVWRYNHVPESYFNSAKNELGQLSNDVVLYTIVETEQNEVVAALKEAFFRYEFPLISAFRNLDGLYVRLDNIYNSFEIVLGSYRTDLYNESQDFQMLASLYMQAIRSVMNLLKEDPAFITESNAQAALEIQYAQQSAAAASQSAATAAWINAFRPGTIISVR